MKFLPNRLIAATAAAVALALAGGFVPAQAQQLAQTDDPAAAQVDEGTLRDFAQASLDVETVIDKWTSRIEEAQDNDEAEEMRASANEEIAQAVQANGLDMEDYNQIYQLAQADPDVATEIQRYREELQ